MPRVALFLDYQNVYFGARDRFFSIGSPPQYGNVNPHRLAHRIIGKRLDGGTLVGVHVYRGLPDSGRDPVGYACALRQESAHTASGRGLVRYHQRPLRYPVNWPDEEPQENGIDVALAVDFVMMALRDEYDVGVLFSTDTDLKPALEAVSSLREPGEIFPRCEVATWTDRGYAPRLFVKGLNLWCHNLDRQDFEAVADQMNYLLTDGSA